MSAKKVLHYVKEIAQTIPKNCLVLGGHLFAVMKGLLLSTILLAIILNHALGGTITVQNFVYLHVYIGLVQKCTEKFMDLSLVKYRAQNMGRTKWEYPINGEVRVLQEYQFNCSSTNITSILLGIIVRVRKGVQRKVPKVQLYRPNSNDHQYTRVDSSMRSIYYSTSNYSTNGVYEYPLKPPISVNKGDLLAISQPQKSQSIVTVFMFKGVFLSQSMPFTNTLNLSTTIDTDRIVLAYPITTG